MTPVLPSSAFSCVLPLPPQIMIYSLTIVTSINKFSCMYKCICIYIYIYIYHIYTHTHKTHWVYLALLFCTYAHHLKIDKIRGNSFWGEYDAPSFRGYWSPVVLHVAVGLFGISMTHAGPSTGVISVTVLFRLPYCWSTLLASFTVKPNGDYLAAHAQSLRLWHYFHLQSPLI